LQSDGKLITSSAETPQNIEIREFDTPDWDIPTTFWDGKPSWQNSVDAINRGRKMKRVLGAYLDGTCVGYIVFSLNFGRVAQLAVDKNHRNRGIGTALMLAMQNNTADGFSMQIINIDKSIKTAMSFFHNRGFYERLGQYEMVMQM
jgi:GNAT superfamily N-acetyltransferase